ncbi:LPS export ABC transporter ATP-binding protein [Thermodesulfobacteriota bacterium]
MHTLAVEGLTKRYRGKEVVSHVTLEVGSGQVVGLLGPNGAGKTTTFYMVVGMIPPDAGRIILDGENIIDLPMYKRARKGISYLPQEPSVFRKLSVRDNLLLVVEMLGLSREEQKKRLDGLLGELGLDRIADRMANSLSGGERRRVEITRALAISPTFILLDEPFAGIDPIAVLDIQSIITQLTAKGIGVLITDHNVRETLGICDIAYILNEGKILESGDRDRIVNSRRAREIYLGDGFRL